MLKFNTSFSIPNTASIDDFLIAIFNWRIKSPHSKIQDLIKKNIDNEEDWKVEGESESFEVLQNYKVDGKQLVAAKYFCLDRGNSWTTEIAGKKGDDDFVVSVKVYAETSAMVPIQINSKTPLVIREIVDSFGGAMDSFFEIKGSPFYLKGKVVDHIAGLIDGKVEHSLPCIYLSITNEGEHLVNAKRLAKKLMGMAHVLVEPDVNFSFILKGLANDRPAFNGFVKVYWPDVTGCNYSVYDPRKCAAGKFEDKIFHIVKEALLYKQMDKECSFSYAKELKLKGQIEDTRSQVEGFDGFLDEVSAEIDAKNAVLENHEEEIRQLKSKIRFLESNNEVENGTFLCRGNCTDLYQAEMQDLITEFVVENMKTVSFRPRAKHLLNSFIDANPKCGRRDQIKSELKTVFYSFERLDAATKNKLVALGFELEDAGKHVKMYYGENRDHCATIAKTPSDKRTGKNTFSDIRKTFF